MQQTLSARLREGTREAHTLAENSPFIKKFFTGQLPRDNYREFLIQLFYIYSAMEEQQDKFRDHDIVGKIYFPELRRRQALLQDLNFYYSDSQWQQVSPLKATDNYVGRIRTLAHEWPEGLVPHFYTRYLGDLSGGQALKRIVAKTYELSSNGLAFYEFSQIEDYTNFKNKYRAQLDVLPIDDAVAQKLVDEANHAFDLNRAVFDEMLKLMR